MSEAVSLQLWKDYRLSWLKNSPTSPNYSLSLLPRRTTDQPQELLTGLLHVSQELYKRKLHVLLLCRCRYNSDRNISLQRYSCSNIGYLAACWLTLMLSPQCKPSRTWKKDDAFSFLFLVDNTKLPCSVFSSAVRLVAWLVFGFCSWIVQINPAKCMRLLWDP